MALKREGERRGGREEGREIERREERGREKVRGGGGEEKEIYEQVRWNK